MSYVHSSSSEWLVNPSTSHAGLVFQCDSDWLFINKGTFLFIFLPTNIYHTLLGNNNKLFSKYGFMKPESLFSYLFCSRPMPKIQQFIKLKYRIVLVNFPLRWLLLYTTKHCHILGFNFKQRYYPWTPLFSLSHYFPTRFSST